MKVAFFVYPSAFQSPGGGEILLLKTKEALEKKGVEVKLFDQWHDKLKDFDILHVFGSVKDCLGLMETAKKLGVKIVLSPIFWSTLQRAIYESGPFGYKSVMAMRHMAKVALPSISSDRRRMLLLADAVVPNSKAELEQVARLFAIDKEMMSVVYVGVDEKFAGADPGLFNNKYKVKDFVLSVGRIEPRKNQLNLIKAVKGLGKKLVLIGDPVPAYNSYYDKCKKAAGADVLFVQRVDHEDPVLASAYAACSVFVLQGWFETPGLVAMEAGLAGARLAVTSAGSTREYFKDHAEYFNPASPTSILKALNRALSRPKSDALSHYLKDNFLWSNSADQNIKVYEKLIK